MNVKKIAGSVATLATVGSVLAGATFALFSDQATSQDNTFSTGNASLLIANDLDANGPDSYGESVPGMSFSNIAPGFEETRTLWLKNDSTGTFGMSTTADLTAQGVPGGLEEELVVTLTCDTDATPGINVGDVTVSKSVSAWYADPAEALDNLGTNAGATNATTTSDTDELLCQMTASLDSSYTNVVAGQSVSFDGVFDGTQI